MKVAIIGRGSLGQLIAHYAQQQGNWQVLGFYDDFVAPEYGCSNPKILGKIAQIKKDYQSGLWDGLFMGIGYKHFETRARLFRELSSDIFFPNFIHERAYVDPSCRLGQGIIILPHCTLDKDVQIADNVFMNIACHIAHDSQIAAHTFLAPGVNIASQVQIGQACFLGIATTIIDQIVIDSEVQTGANTTVTKNIHQKGIYVGSPARRIE